MTLRGVVAFAGREALRAKLGADLPGILGDVVGSLLQDGGIYQGCVSGVFDLGASRDALIRDTRRIKPSGLFGAAAEGARSRL